MKKIKVNRNILWANTFVSALADAGVKYACISPGSRSTPLTYTFTTNKKIHSISIIDERSAGFFALGLAKVTANPVVLVCTSGTAVAEFYPAIIEAYQSKIPLIVCTADRPPELQNVGANQTINQTNIYRNHICWFSDAGLPEVNKKKLHEIENLAKKAILECTINNIGPVHINFPFKKPFEPNTITDEISESDLQIHRGASRNLFIPQKAQINVEKKKLDPISAQVKKYRNGIIVVGVDNYTRGFPRSCIKLSQKIGYPIFADAASNMRFALNNASNIITNYDSYLRSKKFVSAHKPDFIIQFGRNFSSKALSNFIADSSCKKLLVNKFGDWKNSWNKMSSSLAYEPENFCNDLTTETELGYNSNSSDWLRDFLEIDVIADSIKNKVFGKSFFPNEIRIVKELLNEIPNGSSLMVSNSLPIRDFDLISPITSKKITVYHNRGASGIDGIISTALGIAKVSNSKTYLLTGDLAFYYDMNSLLTAKKFTIPLTIILINNNGGRIFEVLPISEYKNVFEKYFVTPHNLDFSKFIKAFGGNYYGIKSWKNFKKILKQTSHAKQFSVLEIKTNSQKSFALRRKYYKEVIDHYESISRD